MRGRFRRAILAVAAMALVGTAVAGGVLAVTTVKTYTGCLTVSGGTLILIKEGQSPQKPCPSGTVQVRLSEGDITSVTAGTGLTGGGTSGDVTLSIATGFRLPQGCAAGKIAKWDGDSWECADDANTTYTAGTGLALDGTELSIAETYRLPQGCEWGESPMLTSAGTWGCVQAVAADQACPSGQFVKAANGDGDIVCAAPAAGSSTIPYVMAVGTDQGIPDDGAFHTIAELTPGAGTWLILATATVTSTEDVSSFTSVECAIRVDGLARQSVVLGPDTLNSATEVPIALNVAFAVTSGFRLACAADNGADGVGIENINLIGVKLGA